MELLVLDCGTIYLSFEQLLYYVERKQRDELTNNIVWLVLVICHMHVLMYQLHVKFTIHNSGESMFEFDYPFHWKQW